MKRVLNKSGILMLIAAAFTLGACGSPTNPGLPPGYLPAEDPLPPEVTNSMAAFGIARDRVLARDGCYYVYGADGSVSAMSNADGSGRICAG